MIVTEIVTNAIAWIVTNIRYRKGITDLVIYKASLQTVMQISRWESERMREYKNTQEEYVNDERRIYDEEGNLIAIEYEDGITEFFD